MCDVKVFLTFTSLSVNNRKTVKTVMIVTWYWHFLRNGGLNQILKRQTSPFHYGSKFPAVTITVYILMSFDFPFVRLFGVR
jgi:hypothetical protein